METRKKYTLATGYRDIANWLDNQPIAAYRENVSERIARWVLRNRALVTIVAAYLVMRIIIILWVHR